MITTLCISCNKPAPEFDAYQELAAELLSQIAAGITLIRIANQRIAAKIKDLPHDAEDWMKAAEEILHRGNDYREMVAEATIVHQDCDAWKVTYRRMTALCVDLDFERRELITHLTHMRP